MVGALGLRARLARAGVQPACTAAAVAAVNRKRRCNRDSQRRRRRRRRHNRKARSATTTTSRRPAINIASLLVLAVDARLPRDAACVRARARISPAKKLSQASRLVAIGRRCLHAHSCSRAAFVAMATRRN